MLKNILCIYNLRYKSELSDIEPVDHRSQVQVVKGNTKNQA